VGGSFGVLLLANLDRLQTCKIDIFVRYKWSNKAMALQHIDRSPAALFWSRLTAHLLLYQEPPAV
jgi:hypothetical protein